LIYDQCSAVWEGGGCKAVSLHAKHAQRAVMGIALPYSTPGLEGCGSSSPRHGALCMGGSVLPV